MSGARRDRPGELPAVIRVLHLAAIDEAAKAFGMERVVRDIAGYPGERRSRHAVFALSPARRRSDLGWIGRFVAAARAADVIHTHDLFGWAAGPAVLRAAGRPVVAHDHGASLRAGRARRVLERAVEGRIARHIAPSRAMAARLGAAGVPEAKIAVVPNGVDPATLVPARDVRPDLGLRPAHVLCLSTARLVPEKGIDVLVEAAGLARRKVPELVVAIAGEGPLRPAGEGVRYLGYRRDIPDLLAAADLVALLSREEPFGLALVEAALAGRAAVGAAAGGIPEVIADGETGILVPPGDVPRAAAALVGLARDRPLRERLGRAARERALRLFTLERVIRDLDAIYEAACGGAGSGSSR